MTARILVVDDLPVNRLLLQAQLTAEYFHVVSASDGAEALDLMDRYRPDIVLLDIMMPGMNGFEVCRRIKGDRDFADTPVVLVTALDQPADRLEGLEAGADDFLTKPVDEAVLVARVRNLVRLKLLIDELRVRQSPAGTRTLFESLSQPAGVSPSRILLVDQNTQILTDFQAAKLPPNELTLARNEEEALAQIASRECDLVVVNLDQRSFDGLRLCAQIRANPDSRQLPLIAACDPDAHDRLARAFSLGVNECLARPIDLLELSVRVRTQLRNKLYLDRLRQYLADNTKLAYTDELTGLPNRHCLAANFEKLVLDARDHGDSLSLLVIDVDHFKQVNDGFGHDEGDEVLKEVARRISANLREADLVCRYGGEEFLVILRRLDEASVGAIAERLRQAIETDPIPISRSPGALSITTSVGVAHLVHGSDNEKSLFLRADRALFAAKKKGRNRVEVIAA
jgi:two-component system cell cycle response regulator